MSQTATQPARFVNAPAFTFVGLDQRFTFENRFEIPQLWQKFVPRIGEIPSIDGKVFYGVSHDFAENEFGYMCAAETETGADVPEGMAKLSFPAQEYAVFPHEGHLSTLCDTIDAANKWLDASGRRARTNLSFLERYGENFDPVAMKDDVELWFPVQGE